MFPWHQAVLAQLVLNRTRLPNAWLLHGQAGIGKLAFAESLAAALLCATPQTNGEACGQCQSCRWLKQESHPDFRRICPPALKPVIGDDEDASPTIAGEDAGDAKEGKKASREIGVAQIRALPDFVNVGTHCQGLRVILIYPMESMNLNAANALLKTLEEPTPHTLFILVADSLALLPTILSRCQRVFLPTPTETEALSWLNAQEIAFAKESLAVWGGAPRLVLEQDNYPWLLDWLKALTTPRQMLATEIADKFYQAELHLLLTLMQRWIFFLSRIKIGKYEQFANCSLDTAQTLVNKLELSTLLAFWQKLLMFKKHAEHPLNSKLVLENLWFEYAQLWRKT